jgi:hypothetical protein
MGEKKMSAPRWLWGSNRHVLKGIIGVKAIQKHAVALARKPGFRVNAIGVDGVVPQRKPLGLDGVLLRFGGLAIVLHSASPNDLLQLEE